MWFVAFVSVGYTSVHGTTHIMYLAYKLHLPLFLRPNIIVILDFNIYNHTN